MQVQRSTQMQIIDLLGHGHRLLNALAPTQTEPPFAITQAIVLAVFVLITLIAVIKFLPPARRIKYE
jgi:hypothetical protein